MLQPLDFAEQDLTEYETEDEANSSSHRYNIWCDCEKCWETAEDRRDHDRDREREQED